MRVPAPPHTLAVAGARGVHNERTAACLRMERVRVVYFTVQQRNTCEAARFSTDTPADEVKGQLKHDNSPSSRKVMCLKTRKKDAICHT